MVHAVPYPVHPGRYRRGYSDSVRNRHQTPEPLDSNEVTVVGVMTALWAVALGVLLLLGDRLPAGKQWWIWVCVAGIGGGLCALAYVRKRRRGIEKRRNTLG